jgi:hypothetical protein
MTEPARTAGHAGEDLAQAVGDLHPGRGAGPGACGRALRLYALAPPTDEISTRWWPSVRAPLVRVPPLSAAPCAGLLLAPPAPGADRAAALSACAGRGAWRGHAARVPARGLAGGATAPATAWRICTRTSSRRRPKWPPRLRPLVVCRFRSRRMPRTSTPRAADLQRRLRAARFTVTCTEANRRPGALAPEARVQRMYHGIDQPAVPLRAASACRRSAAAAGRGPPARQEGPGHLIDACRLLHSRGWPSVARSWATAKSRSACRRRSWSRASATPCNCWASWRASRSSRVCPGRRVRAAVAHHRRR